MPLDTSIISSYNPGAAPDVNAMLTQQMQGMQNINTLERQRAQDALDMQDREAANLARALAPAIGSVFADPSDEGLNVALGMVPEQYRGAMQAQVDQLRAIPDLNRRKDVVRAALVQDEIGQALLAQLEPSANMRLQADTAAQAQALRARELSLKEKEFERGPQMTPYQAETLKLAKEKAARDAAKVSPEAAKQQQAVNDMKLAVTELTAAAGPGGLIDMSTGSIAGDWLDSLVAQGSGGFINLPGDVAAAQMEVVAHLARMAVPRFEGPQSEKDAALYERASGQLADPTTSTTIKKAAAQTLINIINKRRDQFVSPGAGTDDAAGADSGVLEYDEDGNLIE